MTLAAATQPEMVMIDSKESAVRFADQLQGLMISLTRHLERETAALRKGDYREGLADHETKADLVYAYRDALNTLKAHQNQLSRFVPVKLDELRKLNTAFQAALQVNLAAVSTARAVSEQLLTRLADQVSANRKPKTYGANGAMTAYKQAAAISVDRAL